MKAEPRQRHDTRADTPIEAVCVRLRYQVSWRRPLGWWLRRRELRVHEQMKRDFPLLEIVDSQMPGQFLFGARGMPIVLHTPGNETNP